MKTIKFKGVCSGDGESFCFEVDRETFINVTNREPEDWEFQSGEYIDKDGDFQFVPQDPDKCRLYPNDLFGSAKEEIEVEIKVGSRLIKE